MATTPNMNLTLPIVSQTTGPTWANQINADLSVIDGHNHVPGSGAQIPSAALNINANVDFATNSAIGLNSTQYINQNAIASACALYAYQGELYYNDSSSVPVQITSNGSVVGPQGQWTNLAPPAEAAFNIGTGTFSFKSNSTTFGRLQAAILTLQATSTSNPISVIAPSATAAYNLTLPTTAAPQTGSLLSSDSSGTMSWVVGDATVSVTSSTIGVAPLGITAAQLASNAVETLKIKNNAVTQIKMENKSTSGTTADGVNVGPTNTVVFSSFTANFIAGRPVLIALDCLQGTGTAPAPVPAASSIVATGNPSMYIAVTHPNGTTQTQMGHFILGSGYTSPSSVQAIFNVVSSGTHTIQLASYCGTVFDGIVLSNGFFKAFQL